MPNRDDRTPGRWRLAARPLGEVLAACADHRGLSLAVFVSSGRRTPREIEGRLMDIIDGAAVAAARDAGPRAIPGLLHHTLEGVLRWHEELARHGERGPFHLFAACDSDLRMISVACLSGDTTEVVVDGESFDAPWLTALSRGDIEVRAFSIYGGRRRDARVAWTRRADGNGGAAVEAEWIGAPGAAADAGILAFEEERPALIADPSREAPHDASVEPAEAAPPRIEVARAIARGVASVSQAPARAWGMRAGPALVPGARPGHAAPVTMPRGSGADTMVAVDTGDGPEDVAGGGSGDDVARDDAVAVGGAPPLRDDAHPDAGEPYPFLIEDDAPFDDDAPFAADETMVSIEDVETGAGVVAAPAPRADAAAEPVAAPIPVEPAARTARVETSDAVAAPDPIETGAAVRSGGGGARAPRFAPLRPAWPSEEELKRPRRLRRMLPWAIGVIVLFAIGWLVGTTGQGDGRMRAGWTHALRAAGLGGAWFDASITSRPPGAWISVDGKELARRTPATIELKPGVHRVTLALDGLGETTVEMRGGQGEKVPLEVSLLGSLMVRSTDPDIPIEVSVDGSERGYAPLVVSGLDPGPHTVEFKGPGMTPWGTTVEVRVNGEAEAIARPFESPATGVIEVQAFIAGDGGPVEVNGAAVRVDGRPAGGTPLTLELGRGPHSIVASRGGETAPVQVIDLPGGNQRFARFTFGNGAPAPRLTFITGTGPIPTERPYPVSASLEGVSARDVREMWLHVASPDGAWRRYPMAMLGAAGAVVGTVVFPAAALDDKGRAPCYASALTATGDEYFTELQNAPDSGRRVSSR